MHLNISQVASHLGISNSSVVRMIRNNILVATRSPGGQSRITLEELARYLSTLDNEDYQNEQLYKRQEQTRSARACLEAMKKRKNTPLSALDIASFSDNEEPVSNEIHNQRLEDLLSIYGSGDDEDEDLSEQSTE